MLRPGWLVWAGLALGAGPAFALDLAGAGEQPGLVPAAWWFAWGNDYQGNAPSVSADDFRTNRFDTGLRLGPWTLAADWSNLTTRNPTGQDPVWGADDPLAAAKVGAARMDELTLTGLHRWGQGGPLDPALALGPALRLDGNLGGEQVQAGVHAATASHGVILPYERSAVRALPGAAAQAQAGAVLAGPWMVLGRTAALATTRAEWTGEASLRTGLMAGANAVWIGPLYALRAGSPGSRVARVVADHERGPWLVAGVETPGLVLSVGNQIGGDAVEGRLTFRSSEGGLPSSPWPCEAETGVIPAGSQPKANEWTLRVRVGVPSEDPWLRRLRATIEGLRGELDLPNTHDMSGSVRRVMAGVQLDAWPLPDQGPVCQPYVGTAAGWHRAEVHNEDHYGFTQEDRIDTPVASAEVGLRLGWCARTWRSGASLAWAWVATARDGTVPWATNAEAGESVLSRDGSEVHLRWWLAIGW